MMLPDEIWRLIFGEHLDLVETVRCRRVSKRFKYLVDQLRPTELLVYGYRIWPCSPSDHKDDRSPAHWIQLYRFQLTPNSSFHIVFANLKVLELNMPLGETLWGVWDEKAFNVEIFNEFVLLENLYLNRVRISRNQTLRLPNLRAFSITLYSKDEHRMPRLVLDSKVQRLFCSGFDMLVIGHPELIEFFQCYDRHLERNPPTHFKNLRVLRVWYSELSDWMLKSFEKSLEELHLELLREESVIALNQLITRRATLQREVKIYVAGVCLPSNAPLQTSINVREYCSTAFRIRNYHRLADRLHGFEEEELVYYGKLIDCLDSFLGEVPTDNRVELNRWRFTVDFFEKFPYIWIVYVNSEVKGSERLLWFLSCCTRLIELRFSREYLTQSLLNRLPAVCGQLKVLMIPYSTSSGLDLRPVYELKQLFELTIYSKDANLDRPLDLPLLFESCRYLASVSLSYIRIEKWKRYHVFVPEESSLKRGPLDYKQIAVFKYEDLRSNLSAIIEQCKWLRKRTSSHWIWLDANPSTVDTLKKKFKQIYQTIW